MTGTIDRNFLEIKSINTLIESKSPKLSHSINQIKSNDFQIILGYYADTETECQAFHVCTTDGLGGLSKYSFLCPNGTIFNQAYFICDWWFNFDCAEAEGLYGRNDEIAAEQQANSVQADASDIDER